MATDIVDAKKGPRFVENMRVVIWDADDNRWVEGKVTGVSDEGVEIQWEDLPDPTDYMHDRIILNGDVVEEWNSRKAT